VLLEKFDIVYVLTQTTTTTTTFNCLFSRTTWISQYQKGKTSLDLNEERDGGGFGMAVASAGPYANNLHLAPDRKPQHLVT